MDAVRHHPESFYKKQAMFRQRTGKRKEVFLNYFISYCQLFLKEAKELFLFHPLWFVAEHGLAANEQLGVLLEVVHHVCPVFFPDHLVRLAEAKRPRFRVVGVRGDEMGQVRFDQLKRERFDFLAEMARNA